MSNVDLEVSILTKASAMFYERDALADKLRTLDYQIQNQCLEYGQAMRVWMFTPLMLRKACKSRGLFVDPLPPTLQDIRDQASVA